MQLDHLKAVLRTLDELQDFTPEERHELIDVTVPQLVQVVRELLQERTDLQLGLAKQKRTVMDLMSLRDQIVFELAELKATLAKDTRWFDDMLGYENE